PSGAPDATNASQSYGPPKPPVNVTVSEPPFATVNVLTVSVGPDVTVNVTAFDVPPPGAGVTTVTCGLPATARSAAVISAHSCLARRWVVCRASLFPPPTVVGGKLSKRLFILSAAAPAMAVFGFSDVMTGAAGTTLICELVAARV